MSSNRRKTLAKVGLVWLMLLVAGCAEFGMNSNRTPDAVVKSRAQAWADALLAGDLAAAWAFTSPNYREFSTSKDYSRFVLGSGRWTSAVVNSVQCEEEVCTVSILVDYEIKLMKMSNQRSLDYKWVLVDGEWWLHVPAK